MPGIRPSAVVARVFRLLSSSALPSPVADRGGRRMRQLGLERRGSTEQRRTEAFGYRLAGNTRNTLSARSRCDHTPTASGGDPSDASRHAWSQL